MKTNFKSIILLVAAFIAAWSCEKAQVVAQPEEEPEVQTQTLTFKCVFGDSAGSRVDIEEQTGKTTWEVGDQILVHGDYTNATSVTVTLTANDISADGKEATISVTGVTPSSRSVEKGYLSTIYAAYPAEAVIMNDHCYFYSRFNDTNHPLMAAYNDGNTLVFYNLCSVLSFRVSGNYDSYSFHGNGGETVGYSRYQTYLVIKGDGTPRLDFNYTSDNGTSGALTTISGPVTSDGQTQNYICVPNGVSLSNGFTIKLYQNGAAVKTISTRSGFSLAREDFLALGDVTSHLRNYSITSENAANLGANGTANCYIVPPGNAGEVFKFPAVQGNSASDVLTDMTQAVILWQTNNDAADNGFTPVIESAAVKDGYVYFKMPDTFKAGNAVLAAKDAEGTILWSWHIWVPSTAITDVDADVDEDGINDGAVLCGAVMMDRNLGALKAATADEVTSGKVYTYGLLYQWGRKDPFPGAKRVTSDSQAIVSGMGTVVAPGPISLEASIQNPTTLGYQDADNWMTESDNTLWQDNVKTKYDPCPPGYKVPARNTSTVFWNSAGIVGQTGWAINASAYWFSIGNPLVVFPLAGYKDDSSTSAGCYKAGKRALVWSAHASSADRAYGLDVRSDASPVTAKLSQPAKSRCGSVRCVVEAAN